MTAQLTVLVPNYNRPAALARLLNSVFDAVRHANADDHVQVLVVDDYSDEDLSEAIEPHGKRHNFTFKLQACKCGNAETAFLSALDSVETEYVWLLGNDDWVSVDSVKYVLRILDSMIAGFVLLNPYFKKPDADQGFVPISATATSVVYERTEDLFMDFGFVTSTTTFPCLIMKVAPVRAFHRQHRLIDHATVYSHTFTIFGALREEPGLFLSTPIVGFTLSTPWEEQRKLQRQAPAGIMFYHHTLGLARLIRECSKVTGVTIERLGTAFEDEIDKNVMQVLPMHLSHFLTFFFAEQLWREQNNVEFPQHGFAYLARSEVDEICSVIGQFEDDGLWRVCVEAVEAFNWQGASPHWKMHFLRLAQDRLRRLARDKYENTAKCLPAAGPKKVFMPNHVLTPLRGMDGGRCGQMARPGA